LKEEYFLAESVHGLSFERACVGAALQWQISFHMHSLQDEAMTANNAVFSCYN